MPSANLGLELADAVSRLRRANAPGWPCLGPGWRTRVLADALAVLPAAARRSLGSSLPALRELTRAVGALADDVQQDARQIANEATV